MDFIEVIGMVAATCTTVSFVPQVIKIWRTRSTRDISLTMFLVFNIGLVFWLAYGLAIQSRPIILSNTVTLCLTLTILFLKIRYR